MLFIQTTIGLKIAIMCLREGRHCCSQLCGEQNRDIRVTVQKAIALFPPCQKIKKPFVNVTTYKNIISEIYSTFSLVMKENISNESHCFP